ncbi:MAG: hypothetical protein KGL90_15415 [Burkholderiales bacterium]|nr:hypothetical protein [Burkholderiales bacterium]
MTSLFLIPTQPGAQSVTVPLAGVSYRLRLWWCESATPAWLLDIATENGAALVRGLPLLPGADILAQHKHLGIGGGLYMASDGAPTYDSLGTSSKLYFLPDS